MFRDLSNKWLLDWYGRIRDVLHTTLQQGVEGLYKGRKVDTPHDENQGITKQCSQVKQGILIR